MQAAVALLLAVQAPKAPPLKDALIASEREYFSVAFSPDGTTLAAGGARFLRFIVVPADDGKFPEGAGFSQPGQVDELLFDLTGRYLVARGRGQEGVVWDVAGRTPLKYALEGISLAEAGEGGWLPLSERIKGLRLWRVEGLSGKRRFVEQADLRDVMGVQLGHVTALAGTGRPLLVGDDQGYLYRVPEMRLLFAREQAARFAGAPPRVPRSPAAAGVFRPHAGEIVSLSLTADGKLSVSAGLDGKVRLWSVEKIPVPDASARPAAPPSPGWEAAGHAAELSRDGKLLAVADAEGVGVYHAASGLPLSWNPTRGAKGRVVRLRFSPDGRHLAAILCRCGDCAGVERVQVISARRRLAEHGGALLVWR
jgi:WD40 repeat protein